MQTDTEYEWWGARASLLVTDPQGRHLDLPAEVRAYMIAGAPHFAEPGAEAGPRPPCALPVNPNHAGAPMRALLGHLEAWEGYGPGVLCPLQGAVLPLAATRAGREAAGDPSPSLEERYPTPAAYAAAVRAAADRLVAERLLLAEDAAASDALFAVLCGCGHNIRKILAHLRALLAALLASLIQAIDRAERDQITAQAA
jgi:Alpha/beta hydrolase domain